MVEVEVEWEGEMGRDESRDSMRRDWCGGRKRALVWRKERVAAAAEERRRSSGSFGRSFSDLLVGFLWDFRFLEFTNAGVPLAGDFMVAGEFPAAATIAFWKPMRWDQVGSLKMSALWTFQCQ